MGESGTLLHATVDVGACSTEAEVVACVVAIVLGIVSVCVADVGMGVDLAVVDSGTFVVLGTLVSAVVKRAEVVVGRASSIQAPAIAGSDASETSNACSSVNSFNSRAAVSQPSSVAIKRPNAHLKGCVLSAPMRFGRAVVESGSGS